MKTPRTPSYRLHKRSGQAVVTIGGKDHYLGKFGSVESRSEYDRLLAEWLSAGRGSAVIPSPTDGPTINEILLAYWRHAENYYRAPDGSQTKELVNMRDALRPLRKLYGLTPARDFGPLALRAVRESMIRSGLAYTTINARINRIRRVFRWAGSVELIPGTVNHNLQTIEPLQRGLSKARDPKGVKPVSIQHVEKTLPFLPKPVAAMVRLQLLSGCRAGEVTAIRRKDVVARSPNWEYRPPHHKNQWRGHERIILFAVAAYRGDVHPLEVRTRGIPGRPRTCQG